MKKLLLAVLLVLPMTIAAQTLKLAHLNSQEILTAMPETTTAQNTLKSLQDKYRTEIQKTQDEFQKKMADYQKAVQAKTLPENIEERRRKELEDMASRAQQFQKDAQTNLQKKEQELMAPIYTKLDDAIQKIGAAEGYTYIFDLARMPVAYVNTATSVDLTSKVKASMGIK